MTPGDEAFREDALDTQLTELARAMDEGDQSTATPTSRAYRALAQLHAPAARREAESIERVWQRLTPHVTASASAAEDVVFDEPVLPVVHDPPDARVAQAARRAQPQSRLRALASGIAAALAVGFLLSGFLAVLHMGQATPVVSTYSWHVIPSPNTSLAVNALTGITVRTSADAWAWGESNVAPTNGSGTASNPIHMPLVEHWDGDQWRIVATPQPTQGGQIAAIAAIAADDAWAVGSQTTGGPENTGGAPLVEHWDGHTWTIRPDAVGDAATGGAGGLSALAALSAADIWAVGASDDPAGTAGLIEHWDGSSWQTVAHPTPPSGVQFTGMSALSADDIWAVGQASDKPRQAVFEHWDGHSWTIVPSPSSDGAGPLTSNRHVWAISAVSATDAWAAGVENSTVPVANWAKPLFEHWDGYSWSVVDGPSLTGSISAIVALGPDDVWAVGIQGFGVDTGQQGQGLVEHWDGRQWSVIANPSPQAFTQLSGIGRDPATPGKIWVVGTTGPTHGGDMLYNTETLIETTP